MKVNLLRVAAIATTCLLSYLAACSANNAAQLSRCSRGDE